MLTNNEIEKIEKFLNDNPRLSGRKLLGYIKENFTRKDDNKKSINQAIQDGIHIIYKDGIPDLDKNRTRKREVEDGFKIRTVDESRTSDRMIK